MKNLMTEAKRKAEMRQAKGAADSTAVIPQTLFRTSRSGGYTLIELMIVLAIMGILITLAQPSFKKSLVRARETVLMEDLYQLRDAIDQYYADNSKYPNTLEDLISSQDRSRSYMREIPKDPFTNARDWITVAPQGDESGVFDVHSASALIALDGTAYNTW